MHARRLRLESIVQIREGLLIHVVDRVRKGLRVAGVVLARELRHTPACADLPRRSFELVVELLNAGVRRELGLVVLHRTLRYVLRARGRGKDARACSEGSTYDGVAKKMNMASGHERLQSIIVRIVADTSACASCAMWIATRKPTLFCRCRRAQRSYNFPRFSDSMHSWSVVRVCPARHRARAQTVRGRPRTFKWTLSLRRERCHRWRRPCRIRISHVSSADSAKSNNSRSALEIMPSSTNASKFTIRCQ